MEEVITLNITEEYVGQYRLMVPFFPPVIKRETQGVYKVHHCDVDITVEWTKKQSPYVTVLITTREDSQSPQNSIEFVTTVIFNEYLNLITSQYKSVILKPSDVTWELQEINYRRRYKLELTWNDNQKRFTNTEFN